MKPIERCHLCPECKVEDSWRPIAFRCSVTGEIGNEHCSVVDADGCPWLFERSQKAAV